jgi:dethiobiotin synthase
LQNALRAAYIFGTGTDVGKTVVTAGLLANLGGAQAIKPVQTGPVRDEEVYARACPGARYGTLRHFPLAASPHLAAARAGVRLDLGRLAEELAEAAALAPFTLIEGAGGPAPPLTPTETVLDLAARRPWPAALVVENKLGALNQTLLAVEALERRVKVAGLVVNHPGPSPDDQRLILEDNITSLPVLTGRPVLAVVPHQARLNWPELAAVLRPAAEVLSKEEQ